MALTDLFKKMQDDKGLFQGGKQGQTFGRIKDVLGMSPKDSYGNKESYDPGMEKDRDLLQHAREFAKNINVEDSGEVGEMQGLLNALGIRDYEGKSLSADSVMGDRTLSAMRLLQGGSYDEGQGPGPWAYGDEDQGSAPKTWMQRLFGGGGLLGKKAATGPSRAYEGFSNSYKDIMRGYKEG